MIRLPSLSDVRSRTDFGAFFLFLHCTKRWCRSFLSDGFCRFQPARQRMTGAVTMSGLRADAVRRDFKGQANFGWDGGGTDSGENDRKEHSSAAVVTWSRLSHNSDAQGRRGRWGGCGPPTFTSTSPPHPCFSFPSFCLFRSPLSLIRRQTACKCSNPEKSVGAALIGCALRHSSQSIKAR